jgi:hypothetical protein
VAVVWLLGYVVATEVRSQLVTEIVTYLSSVLQCEIWSEEHSVRVCENRALRRIFGPKREKVAGGW